MENGLKECENGIDIAKIVHCVGVLGMGEDGAIVCNLHNTALQLRKPKITWHQVTLHSLHNQIESCEDPVLIWPMIQQPLFLYLHFVHRFI